MNGKFVDPLVTMMRGEAPASRVADLILENEAADLCTLAMEVMPWIVRLPEDSQNAILFFAYVYSQMAIRQRGLSHVIQQRRN